MLYVNLAPDVTAPVLLKDVFEGWRTINFFVDYLTADINGSSAEKLMPDENSDEDSDHILKKQIYRMYKFALIIIDECNETVRIIFCY